MSSASSSTSTTALLPMMYSDELRRSVLIRNAMRTASTISSSRSVRSAAAASSLATRGSASSSHSSTLTSPSHIKERWSMMASRAGVDYYTFMDADYIDDEREGEDNESEEDEYEDYSEEEEQHHDSPTHSQKCTLCEEAATRQAQVTVVEASEETDESVWFDDLLQEVSIEDYDCGDSIQAALTSSGGSRTAEALFPSTSPLTPSPSFSSTSSLPSLIVDDDDYSGEEEEDEIDEDRLTAYNQPSQTKEDHHSTPSPIPNKHTPSLTLSSPSSHMLSPA